VGDANCCMQLLFGHGEDRPKRTRKFSGGIGEHDSRPRANLEIAKRFPARQECRGVANLTNKGIRFIRESFTTLVDMRIGGKRFTHGIQLENETKLEDPRSEADPHNKSLAFLLFPGKKGLPIGFLAICGSPTARIYEVNIARLHKSRETSQELKVFVPFCSGMVNIC
jgi:hypothetical protein